MPMPMSKESHDEHTPIENDSVWKLLGNARTHVAGPRFVDDVVRFSRLHTNRPEPWWARWFTPIPVTACTAAGVAAAVVVGFFALRPAPVAPSVPALVGVDRLASKEAGYAHIQEVLETEMLFAAVEHLDEFSDEELVVLMGF